MVQERTYKLVDVVVAPKLRKGVPKGKVVIHRYHGTKAEGEGAWKQPCCGDWGKWRTWDEICSPHYKTHIRIDASEESDGSFHGFRPKTFAFCAPSETEQVTGRRRRS